MSSRLTRITRNRLYEDEALFNELLPYVKWDEERKIFLHADASLWSIWQLRPLLLTSVSQAQAFQACATIQELLDSLDENISVQFSWVTTFDVNDVLNRCLYDYPLTGVAGWMARRWVRLMKNQSKSAQYSRRPKKLRLVVAFRYDPPWPQKSPIEELFDTIRVLFQGTTNLEESFPAIRRIQALC